MNNTVLTLPTYAFRRPAELDRPQQTPYPVVVVGAGLTGLSAALDLVRRGIAVTVLDDDNTVGVRGLASVEALQNEPLAELRWLNKVTGLRQLPDGVELEVGTPEGSYRTRAQWVVACDGANSGVRACLGLTPQVHDRNEDRWIIIDVIVHNQDWPEERWTWLDAGANGGRAVWRHKMADDTWRLDFQLASDEDAEAAATPEAMRRRVRALVGSEAQFDIAWSGVWGYRHECLEDLRSGRVIRRGETH